MSLSVSEGDECDSGRMSVSEGMSVRVRVSVRMSERVRGGCV